MEAIILAGGFGTRLAHAVQDVPKPMAPIKDAPFLVYVLECLLRFDITRVILATGYKSEVIEGYFGNSYKGMELVYSVETSPLGTGGAIKKALEKCNDEEVFVLNGDTYFDVDLKSMRAQHRMNDSLVTIGVKEMKNFDRYGSIDLDKKSETILFFNEKKKMKKGYINGGVYVLKKNILEEVKEVSFSFEKEYLEKWVSLGKFSSFKSDGYFIDIGIPEDYFRANKELSL